MKERGRQPRSNKGCGLLFVFMAFNEIQKFSLYFRVYSTIMAVYSPISLDYTAKNHFTVQNPPFIHRFTDFNKRVIRMLFI